MSIFSEQNCYAQAWGPLVRGFRFEHPSVMGLATKYGKTPAQVLLRYSLQKVRIMISRIAPSRMKPLHSGLYPDTQVLVKGSNRLEYAHL